MRQIWHDTGLGVKSITRNQWHLQDGLRTCSDVPRNVRHFKVYVNISIFGNIFGTFCASYRYEGRPEDALLTFSGHAHEWNVTVNFTRRPISEILNTQL